jgi:hypothetical protein
MNEDYGVVIECPVCKGQIVSMRVNDDSQFLYFNKDGTHRYNEGKSRGYNEIYCAADKTHSLGDELVQIVLELTNEVL